MKRFENLIKDDILDNDQFNFLECEIIKDINYVTTLNDILELNRRTNWIQNYDDFPSRKFEYPWTLYATELKSKMKVADMGCSIDPFAPLLAKKGLEVYGLDLFSSHDEKWDPINGFRKGKYSGVLKMKKFQEFLKNELALNVNYSNQDMSSTSFKDNDLDRIFCISVLEHLPEYKVKFVLDEWRRILKNDGHVVLTIDYIVDLKRNFNIGKLLKETGYTLQGKVNLYTETPSSENLLIAAFVIAPNQKSASINVFSKIYRQNSLIRSIYDSLYILAQRINRRLFRI